MSVVGIDPSLAATGIATHEDVWTVRTIPSDPLRLATIFDAVACTRATLAVLEDLPSHAQSAGLTGMAQGVVRLALIENAIPYLTVPPATLKKFATGKGNATKADMRMSLYKRTGIDNRDDNQVDAIWLRYLGLALRGELSFDLPQTHLDALKKVTLP